MLISLSFCCVTMLGCSHWWPKTSAWGTFFVCVTLPFCMWTIPVRVRCGLFLIVIRPIIPNFVDARPTWHGGFPSLRRYSTHHLELSPPASLPLFEEKMRSPPRQLRETDKSVRKKKQIKNKSFKCWQTVHQIDYI